MTKSASATDCEATFLQLLKHRPRVAWPTVALCASFVTLFATEITLGAMHLVPSWAAISMGVVASYMSYTILHEAAHANIGTNKRLNEWVGRIGLLGCSITPFFANYRFVHLAHHRYVNDKKLDPDLFCGSGPAWTLPLRWALMDVAYIAAYFRLGAYRAGSKAEKREYWLAFGFTTVLLLTITVTGFWPQFLTFYFLPTRIAMVLLAFTFDYLPHYPHDVHINDNAFRATSNRVGMEWLLTPLLIGQNYHLSHHLYPSIPFYRYRRIWLARKSFHQANGPASVPPFGLHPSPLGQDRAFPIYSTDGGIEVP